MIVSVKFPIRNDVYVKEPWPIRVGSKTYFIDTDQGKAKSVGVRIAGVSPEVAPKIELPAEGPFRANITLNSGFHVLMAEHELRAWEALLAAYVIIDIDFDNPITEFTLEPSDKNATLPVSNFVQGREPVRWRGRDEFSVFGRAFLAIETGMALIEPMSLYREAHKALLVERSIDAYNGFYLFIESLFCRGRTGTVQATNELTRSLEFMRALGMVVENKRSVVNQKVRFSGVTKWQNESRLLVTEIVALRGRLRHHSLSSPHRWDPNRQRDYDAEARFLGAVANNIAFERSSGKLWEGSLPEKFTRLAEETHMTVTIHVRLTIRQTEHIEEIPIDMTFPQRVLDSQLAHAVLTKALEALNERSPVAELFAIRAWEKTRGTELLRYDVGPTLTR